MTDQVTPPPDVVEAVQKIEEFLGMEEIEMSERPGQGHDPRPTAALMSHDKLAQQLAEIEHKSIQQNPLGPRETRETRVRALLTTDPEYRRIANELSALAKRGAAGAVAKAEQPFTQGIVSDMVAAEVEKRAEELRKSEPSLSKEQARAKVWQRDRHLWERYDAHRGAAV
jgi:hypothetical protein